MSGKYQIFQPGEYLDWEKPAVEERLAIVEGAAPQGGGPIGPAGPDTAIEYELLRYNRAWDPYNPLFNDREYARQAGYRDIPAFPGFKFPWAGGMILGMPKDIAEIFSFANDGSDVRYYAPVFPGDTFTTETEEYIFEDLTVPGSDFRVFRLGSTAAMYNQRGELVARNTGLLREGYRKIIDGSPAPSWTEHLSNVPFPPAHYTTDAEWDYIRSLWDREKIRGRDTRYWEDVNIGDEPAWVCSGPVSHMDMIMCYGVEPRDMRPMLRNPKTMFRDRYGQYLFEVAVHFSGRNIPGSRMLFYNDTGTKHITRMVTNYLGDAGFVTRVHWVFRQLFEDLIIENVGSDVLDMVPYMKGRGCTRHGTEGDTVIAKGYVSDKYINDRGEHTIDLACWGETLDGDIVQVVTVSARLPSKGNQP